MRTFLCICIATLLAASIVVWKLQPPASPDGRIVLTWVSDDNPTRKAQAALFEKLHPNIKVNIDPANSGVEKVIVQSLAGVGPDVFDVFNSFQFAAYVNSGVAMDITDELRQSGIDLKTQVFPAALDVTVMDGRAYGIPTNIAADGIWYHADLLREAGLEIPKDGWTWDQCIPIAQKLTQKGPDGRITRYGLLFEWWNWRHFFSGYRAKVYNENGTRCVVDSPSGIAAVQMMYDLVYKYHVSPTPVEETSMVTTGGFGSGYISIFAAKRGAMAIGGRWWSSQLRETKGLELRVAEAPYGTVHVSHAYARSMLVNKHSKHLAEALELQRYLASEPYLELVNDQADGLAVFRQADETPRFLFNPKYPNERDNGMWLKIMKIGVGDDVSPFVDASTAGRLISDQLDLVRAGQKTAAEAMKSAAANVNQAIQKSINEDPTLAARYRSALRSTPP